VAVTPVTKQTNDMAHVKTTEGYDVKVPTQGQANFNSVGAGAGIASFLGLNAGNLLNGFGWGGCGNGWNRNGMGYSCADIPVGKRSSAVAASINSLFIRSFIIIVVTEIGRLYI
jgi:hypothetical protein